MPSRTTVLPMMKYQECVSRPSLARIFSFTICRSNLKTLSVWYRRKPGSSIVTSTGASHSTCSELDFVTFSGILIVFCRDRKAYAQTIEQTDPFAQGNTLP
ncbi:hypothetical protein ABW21_db0208057 [Orbilia brochopaga]|nr:hypothetical protein ABW21_db0208057 [Drechslerella brochopaga]